MSDIAMAAYINKLTVLELVTRLEDWATTNLIGGRSQVYPEREELVAALRKAVIREASVGTIRLGAAELFFDLGGGRHKALIAEPLITVPPDGTYDLIPKETP